MGVVLFDGSEDAGLNARRPRNGIDRQTARFSRLA
jgi:hypothetical protein